ncbi:MULTISPECIES: hypothetical protein [Clostridium]|nr:MULTISPECIES: hypothetical protein [Clostridium]MCC2169922.1 hypothetical protein [Clostridium fessum]
MFQSNIVFSISYAGVNVIKYLSFMFYKIFTAGLYGRVHLKKHIAANGKLLILHQLRFQIAGNPPDKFNAKLFSDRFHLFLIGGHDIVRFRTGRKLTADIKIKRCNTWISLYGSLDSTDQFLFFGRHGNTVRIVFRLEANIAIAHMNGICFNMGLVEVAENTVGLLEFMAEEIVGEGFEGVLGIGGVFIVKCVPVDGCLWDQG